MATSTPVNSQITDAIAQTNVKVLSDSPAFSMGELYIASAEAMGNSLHNLVAAQQQTNATAQAATTMGVATLYGLDTASAGVATKQLQELSKTKEHDALFLSNLKLGQQDVASLRQMQHLKHLHLSNVEIADEHLQSLAAAMPETEIYREQKVKV